MTTLGTYILCGGADDGTGIHRLPKGVTDSKSVQGWYDLAARGHALGLRRSFWRAPGGMHPDGLVAGWELLDANDGLRVLKDKYLVAWSGLGAMGNEVVVHRRPPLEAGTDAAQLSVEAAAFTSASFDELGAVPLTPSLRSRLGNWRKLLRRVGVEPLDKIARTDLLRSVEFVHVSVSETDDPFGLTQSRLGNNYAIDNSDHWLTYKDLVAQNVALSIGVVDGDTARRLRCIHKLLDWAKNRPLVEIDFYIHDLSDAQIGALVSHAGAAID